MKTIFKPLAKLRQSYEHVLSQKQPQLHAVPLNLKLLFNPFLKNEEKFKMLNHEFMLYNKRVSSKDIADQYQVKSYDKLFVIVCEIGNMEKREDQVDRLNETVKWWNQQKRIIKQRKQMSVVKYKTDRMIDRMRDYQTKLSLSQIASEEPAVLPNQMRYVEAFPFEMNYRTAHREMDVPVKRLSEYKRKIININDNRLLEEEPKKNEKVTYPVPKKVDPHEELNEAGNQNPEQTQPLQPQNAQTANAENHNPEVKVEGEDANKPVEEPVGQDLGGFGEEPGQPSEQPADEEEQVDKLAPKNKIYTWSNKQREELEKSKQYQRPYMFYRGHDLDYERRMQQRAIKMQQCSLQMQREEKQFVKKAHEWAGGRSKMEKELQFKLENMTANHSCSFSYEEPEKKEMLSPSDEKKFGFMIPLKSNNAKRQYNLTERLPEIAEFKPLQKQIRKDRLKSLKHKFSTILNLKESSEAKEKGTESMCRTSPQRRNFSMILQQHSLQRQKMLELQQIQKIKESLGKHRININIRTLAHALVPDSEDHKQQTFVSPPKALPNNPFLVEPKKKKKK